MATSQAVKRKGSDDHDMIDLRTRSRRDEPPANEARKTEERAPEKSEQDETLEKKPSAGEWMRAHPKMVIIAVIVLILAIVGGILWWLDARQYENTDDAFIDGRPVAISTQVAGSVTNIAVNDNQVVEAGTVLATIDDRDYKASLAQSAAQIAQAEAGIANVDAQKKAQEASIAQATKQVTEAEAALNFAKDENTRYQDLVQRGAGTAQRAQQASSDLQSKQAALEGAKAAQTGAESQLGVLDAQRKNNEAQLAAAHAQNDQAAANLSRVKLIAPIKGRVTRLTGAKGAYATPGQTLMMLVPLDLWVTANFKETQLALMKPKQPVTLRIDAYGRDFAAHVDSIQAGSGTAFSLLPAENATGNYVKVVQRVPVKIVFDNPPDVELGPGMSVVPSVKVR